MPLVTARSLLDIAARLGNAVAAFDTVDHISTEGILLAAEQRQRPVILMVPEAALALLDRESFFPYLVWRARRASVPVAVQVDHGESLGMIMQAIHHGFSSVMIDGSMLALNDNIAKTRQIVEIAHAAGVSVEAEVGKVGGAEGSFAGTAVDVDTFTDPEDARTFADATGVDALAVAFGTVHGHYKGTPQLDFDRLSDIRARVDTPLVLHGGSGLSDDDFVRAIECGIRKINIFTEISLAAVAQSVAHCQRKDNQLHFAELALVGKQTVAALAGKYIDLFSLGK
jgi:fructose-bisphosphate aldolase, class II